MSAADSEGAAADFLRNEQRHEAPDRTERVAPLAVDAARRLSLVDDDRRLAQRVEAHVAVKVLRGSGARRSHNTTARPHARARRTKRVPSTKPVAAAPPSPGAGEADTAIGELAPDAASCCCVAPRNDSPTPLAARLEATRVDVRVVGVGVGVGGGGGIVAVVGAAGGGVGDDGGGGLASAWNSAKRCDATSECDGATNARARARTASDSAAYSGTLLRRRGVGSRARTHTRLRARRRHLGSAGCACSDEPAPARRQRQRTSEERERAPAHG